MSTGHRNWLGLVLIGVLLSFTACSKSIPVNNSPSAQSSQKNFDSYLSTDIAPANGFDFPVGDTNGKGAYKDLASGIQYDGWYIAVHFNESYSLGIHTGEDWNGAGGGNTDLGQDVHAVANGRVTFADNCGRLWGNVVTIEHRYYENHEPRKIISLYAHLKEIKVKAGQPVSRRQVIATIGQDPEKTFQAHLHLELRWDETLAPTYWPSSNGRDQNWISQHYTSPSQFITTHRSLPVPQAESRLLLVDQTTYKARFYEAGIMRDEYDVSFGQGKGQKQIEGDNKTPKGMYFVVQKHKGQFEGPYAAYYGGHWIKINYPNKYDADRGLAQGIISAVQRDEIKRAWQQRELTLQTTKLGGGIGFHGWNKEWDNNGPRHLSWGCVVMHLSDAGKIYGEVTEGTMVIIF
jgi:murein DD-endopeptidase MepM/ murein hydrolase activator NlpD